MKRTHFAAISVLIFSFSMQAFAQDYISLNNEIGELRRNYIKLKYNIPKFRDEDLKLNIGIADKWDAATKKLIIADNESARQPCRDSKQKSTACTASLMAYKSRLMQSLVSENKINQNKATKIIPNTSKTK